MVWPFQRATRARPWAMSSISMSKGDGSSRSRRRPDSIRCQARGGSGFFRIRRSPVAKLFVPLREQVATGDGWPIGRRRSTREMRMTRETGEFGRIVVPLAGVDGDAALLAGAAAVAERAGAELLAVFTPPDAAELTPWLG